MLRFGDAVVAIQIFASRSISVGAIDGVAISFFRQNRRAIQDEVFAFLIQNGEPVEPKRVAEQIDRRVGLLDNAEEYGRIGNRDGAAFGAAAEFLEQKFELLREFFRRFQFLRHLARGVAGQDKAVVAFSLQKNALED